MMHVTLMQRVWFCNEVVRFRKERGQPAFIDHADDADVAMWFAVPQHQHFDLILCLRYSSRHHPAGTTNLVYPESRQERYREGQRYGISAADPSLLIDESAVPV